MSAAVSTPGQETFSALVCHGKVYDSPPPSPGDGPKFEYTSGSRPVSPDNKASVGKVSVAEQVALAMGIPNSIVEMVKAFQYLKHGKDFTDASEFYTAAESLLNSPQEHERIAKELEKATTEKEIQSIDFIAKVKEVPTESKPAEDKVQMKEKVKKLAEENHRLKQRKMCRACRKVDLASSGITFLPCGHFITCENCSEMFDDCPACGKNIMGTVRTFLS